MRIVHIDLTGPFTVGMNYQENILPEINAIDGNEVYFIATQYKWDTDKLVKAEQFNEITPAGVQIIRLPYINIGIPLVTERLRIVRGLYCLLDKLSPDTIMLHGFQTMSVAFITKYIRRNPECRLVVDTHSDKMNSAPNFVSRYILHCGLYRAMAKNVLKYVSKIWCISYDVMDFSHVVYGIPYDKLEFYPLGGTIFEEKEYLKRRKNIRAEYFIAEDDILLVHSGKMNCGKKTDDLFKMMKEIISNKIKLLLVGEMDAEIEAAYINDGQEDKRVIYAGWKTGDELLSYLCAADIYVQPGTQSATMQNAACCRCALILYPYESHLKLFKDSVFYVESAEDIIEVMGKILNDPSIIAQYKCRSFAVAKEMLDYKKQVECLYK